MADAPKVVVPNAPTPGPATNVDQPAPAAGSSASSTPDLDITRLFGSLQTTLEQVRSSAQAEIERLRREHATEKQQLQGQIHALEARCSDQGDRIRSMQDQLTTLLGDYRGELEGQIQRSEAARAQLKRVQETINSLDQGASPSQAGSSDLDGAPRVQPTGISLGDLRSRALVSSDTPPSIPSAEDTVRITPPATASGSKAGTTQISISGINSVSAMMRARKAVENLPIIQDVESRYASDGKLYFSVRTAEKPEALAKALTSLQDPPLRSRKVSEGAIELEM